MGQFEHCGASLPGERESRIDFLRGLALICMFFDHMPGNALSAFTLERFGFSDAAEIFVFCAGYAAMVAYGGAFQRGGWRTLGRKLAARCALIYAAQALLFLATLAILVARTALFDRNAPLMAPLIDDGFAGVLRGLALGALPAYLDILPLYLVLFASFPLVLVGMRKNVMVVVAAAIAVYAFANVFHVTLPNYIDEQRPGVWTFNPLTWQLVFVLGAACAVARAAGIRALEEPPGWIRISCWLYLVVAAVLTIHDGFFWDHPLYDVTGSFLGNDGKGFAMPWRVLHVCAVVYLVLVSRDMQEVVTRAWAKPIVVCGRHSLAIFAFACVVSLVGRLAFHDFGTGLEVQALVNFFGLFGMISLALSLEARRSGAPQGPRRVDGRKGFGHADLVPTQAGDLNR